MVQYVLGMVKTFDEMREKYGPLYRSDYFLFPQTYVLSYDGVSDVLNDADIFQCEATFPNSVKLFGEDALTQIDGERHAKARAMLAPAFKPTLFPYYFHRITERTLEFWSAVHDNVASGKKVKLEHLFREHYLGITIEMSTGVNANSETSAHLRKLFSTTQLAFLSPSFGPIWNNGVKASAEIKSILADIIRDAIANRAGTIEQLRLYGDDVMKMGFKDIPRGDVDVLLVAIASSSLSTEPGAHLDSEVVHKLAEQILLLWFAGYATAAVTSSIATFEMAWDDNARSALVREQDELVQKAGGQRNVTYEQTFNMPLLDAYIMEVLRLRPAASGVFRRVSRDIEMHGKLLPKDTVVFASIKSAQLDPEKWPHPRVFDPNRFLRTEQKKPRTPPLLAFGGPRSPHYCIGAAIAKMMMKTVFATLLRNYVVTLDPKQSRKYTMIPEEVPESGVLVSKFEKRS